MKSMSFLGIPYYAGQPHQGVKNGPEVFRKALGDLSYQFFIRDLGDITGLNSNNEYSNELISQYKFTESDFHVNFGGDHGMSVGTIHRQLEKHPDLLVVWVDAHGDINPPWESTTGNFHGMPLAYLLGISKFPWMKNFLSPKRLIYWGPRSLDTSERKIIEEMGIVCLTGDDLSDPENLMNAVRAIDPEMESPVHLSFDVDVYRTEDFSATGCHTSGGPTRENIEKMGRELFQKTNVVSMDLVEFNPDLSEENSVEILSTFLKLNSEAIIPSSAGLSLHLP
ncbi:MAG: arginase family protein [Bdellovibrionota bacterium]